jgi:hypothetical protein
MKPANNYFSKTQRKVPPITIKKNKIQYEYSDNTESPTPNSENELDRSPRHTKKKI